MSQKTEGTRDGREAGRKGERLIDQLRVGKVVIVSPHALVDLDEQVSACRENGIAPEDESLKAVRSATNRLPRFVEGNDSMAFDSSRGLWLDLESISQEAREVPEVQLDEPKKSRLKKMVARVRALAVTKSAIGALVSFVIALGGSYERGIDYYLERAEAGHEIFTDNPVGMHVAAPFVGVVEYTKDLTEKISEFGERVEAKDDSLRYLMSDAFQSVQAESTAMPSDHAGISDSTVGGLSGVAGRADDFLRTFLEEAEQARSRAGQAQSPKQAGR